MSISNDNEFRKALDDLGLEQQRVCLLYTSDAADDAMNV